MTEVKPKFDAPWPLRLQRSTGHDILEVSYDNGRTFALPAEYLRVFSPSAEVQGHSPDERKTVGGKRGVRIADVQRVGNYAVRILFDDGHQTGIYAWSYLYELGEKHEENWARYEAELAGKGLSRG